MLRKMGWDPPVVRHRSKPACPSPSFIEMSAGRLSLPKDKQQHASVELGPCMADDASCAVARSCLVLGKSQL